ncbi:MAG: hypothetical protein ACQEVA_13305, partial [Myxococcota bacterium]
MLAQIRCQARHVLLFDHNAIMESAGSKASDAASKQAKLDRSIGPSLKYAHVRHTIFSWFFVID